MQITISTLLKWGSAVSPFGGPLLELPVERMLIHCFLSFTEKCPHGQNPLFERDRNCRSELGQSYGMLAGTLAKDSWGQLLQSIRSIFNGLFRYRCNWWLGYNYRRYYFIFFGYGLTPIQWSTSMWLVEYDFSTWPPRNHAPGLHNPHRFNLRKASILTRCLKSETLSVSCVWV